MIRAVLPLLVYAIFCGLALVGAALAFMADSFFGLFLARAVLAGLAYLTTLEWLRAEQALTALRNSPSIPSPASEPAQDLQ